jgi:hypothetical protein
MFLLFSLINARMGYWTIAKTDVRIKKSGTDQAEGSVVIIERFHSATSVARAIEITTRTISNFLLA